MDIKQVQKVTDFNHLNLFSVKYYNKLGNEKSWIFASRSKEPELIKKSKKKPDAVTIVPFHKEKKKLVIIKEFRVPLGSYQYGFPAGLVEAKDNIEQTASKELKEETGLDIIKILKKSPPVYSSSGMTDESSCIVYVECKGEPSSKWNQASEDISVILISQEEATKLINTPDIKFDIKSWIILSTFSESGTI